MIQSIVVNLVALAAALWLVWSFAPASFRAALTRRRALPAYDAALQADELSGQAPGDETCGCGDKACH